MKYISSRQGIEASAPETVFQGLAPDGGLYLPVIDGEKVEKVGAAAPGGKGPTSPTSPTPPTLPVTLASAERFVVDRLFSDFPESVREEAIARLCSRFPAEDPIPLREVDGMWMLELFHGKTGAFKDVALSMLPVFMRHAANGKRVLILTATSGDTGSAAMQGFAGVEGTEIIVFYPATGTSRIQRLQMTTPAEKNVHAVGIRGNFDDAQAAVKRIFADPKINAEAAARGITLSSANSINTGRLVPQIAYYVLAGEKVRWGEGEMGSGISPSHPLSSNISPSHPLTLSPSFDIVVPSGNFGNILAAYYAKRLGAPINRLYVASNVNDVLARFVKTGVYDPGNRFTVTNSPSMDIRISSNVERLLWELNYEGDESRACAEVKRLMDDLRATGRYELNEAAKAKLFAEFDGGVATPEETEAEMRRLRDACGYLVDPHTAVGTFVAKKLGLGKERPVVVAATATPYKFPETCLRAYGEDVLTDPPKAFADLDRLPVAQTRVVDIDGIDAAVRELF